MERLRNRFYQTLIDENNGEQEGEYDKMKNEDSIETMTVEDLDDNGEINDNPDGDGD